MVLLAIKYLPISEGKTPSLEILDQLLLPHQSTYVPIRTCEEAHDAIKTMKVRGAPAIAIVAALSLAVEVGTALLQERSFGGSEKARDYISQRLEYLKTSRPTAVNLGDAVTKLKVITNNEAVSSPTHERSVFQAFLKAAEQMLVDDVLDNKAIGEYGSKWIQNNTVPGQKEQSLKVLTICNTGSLATAGYGTALGVIRSLHSANKLEQAFCLETRPYNQGSRLTAYELVHDRIPATLLADSMAASLMSRENAKLAAVVVGADRVAANGDTANKIGTYSLAVLAKYHGIKFLVAAPRTTIDLNTPSGESIVIEQRAAEELTRVRGPIVRPDGTINTDEAATISTAAHGINVWNPAFDVTPADLIDGVITEVGVVEKTDGKFDFKPIFDSSG